ncbi:MAG: HD domain-containing protein [Desulfobacterales bacterium]|nr:HD domain-containing protein [Desulfobacterales bacterium]
MKPIYNQLRERARQIVATYPPPDFYQAHSRAYEFSTRFFKTDPAISQLHGFVGDNLEDDFGHGLQHAIKVTIDAGALMHIEGQAAGYDGSVLERRMMIVQCAGLLHDIKRKKKEHAKLGATQARKVLDYYPLTTDEIEDICSAIQNHEAFKSPVSLHTSEGALVSNCLYDADKFRWGPDNFTDTLWDMISFYNPPLSKFMARYPQGMEGLEKIKTTFRTDTGRNYGPQFIDIGLAIGKELYEVIQSEFSEYLSTPR